METRNLYLYWVGKEFKLISILRNIIYLHSTTGQGYKVNFINEENLHEYIPHLPECFHSLCLAHQADFVRVNLICDNGGIWLDSDTLVVESLDCLFDFLEKDKDGFFIQHNNNQTLCNSVFGSKKQTPLMIHWKNKINEILEQRQIQNVSIEWNEIGSDILEECDPSLFHHYQIIPGKDSLFPVNWEDCEFEFINQPYLHYKSILRDFQPLVILVHSVYQRVETWTEQEILQGENNPLHYFIQKSFGNLKLIDYDFMEIGTSNFDTLLQYADDYTVGISVDAVKYYMDQLPDKLNVKKLNVGISNKNSSLDVYYIPERVIQENNLPYWFKGCNCVNNFHPLHLEHKVCHLVIKEKVKVITTFELFYQNQARGVKFLKIDTEGHDCVILKSLFFYLKYLPKNFYPWKIQFESNEHTPPTRVDEIIELYSSIGYHLDHRGYDTRLIFNP